VQELVAELEAAGYHVSPPEPAEAEDDEEWGDTDDEDDDDEKMDEDQ